MNNPNRHAAETGDTRPTLDIIYVAYDGLLEPLGQSQILSYLVLLTRDGYRLGILSFEKAGDLAESDRVRILSERLSAEGIHWTYLPFHHRPRAIAKLYDLASGLWTLAQLVRRHRPRVLHARSYLAATLAAIVKSLYGCRLVFDIRGFWPEERVEMNLLRSGGISYRLAKRLERFLFGRADEVVVLTQPAAAIVSESLLPNAAGSKAAEQPVSVIPCCVDLNRFQPREPDPALIQRLGIRGRTVIGNVGAVNNRYLLHEMFRFTRHLKEHHPDLLFIYLTRQDPSLVRAATAAAGLNESDVLVSSANPEEVPSWMSILRLGVFFLRPSHAAKASSFTKLGEFLASGVPVVTNTGVGDTDSIIDSTEAGIVLNGLQENDLSAGAERASTLLKAARKDSARACRRIAESRLSLDRGVEMYRSVYDRALSEDLDIEADAATAATESA